MSMRAPRTDYLLILLFLTSLRPHNLLLKITSLRVYHHLLASLRDNLKFLHFPLAFLKVLTSLADYVYFLSSFGGLGTEDLDFLASSIKFFLAEGLTFHFLAFTLKFLLYEGFYLDCQLVIIFS